MNEEDIAIMHHQAKIASNETLLKNFAECISMYDHEMARWHGGMAFWGMKKAVIETEILKRMEGK